MDVLDTLENRCCPVCGASPEKAAEFLKSSIDASRVTAFSFSSRKEPEFMNFRLLRCDCCRTVYAPEAPKSQALAKAYHEADYDSAEEANLAADAYAAALKSSLARLAHRGKALEIGAGNGAFLTRLKRLGFAEVMGIEPSSAAIASADPIIRHCIVEGVFREEDYEPASFDLICCFQTLEHVSNPRELTRACQRLLRPNGLLALITHDYQAPINRLLGERSPIIDIEHLQLFCRDSLAALMDDGAFHVAEMQSLLNVYPLSYWMRLAPIPGDVKRMMLAAARSTGIGRIQIGINVGNIVAVGQKRLGQ